MDRNTVYIAGPMSNRPDFNYPAFEEGATFLRSLGYKVVSPRELDAPEEVAGLDPDAVPPEKWQAFLRRDIAALFEEGVGCVALLPGWEESQGATLEGYVGAKLGFTIFELREPDTLTPRLRYVEREEVIREVETRGIPVVNMTVEEAEARRADELDELRAENDALRGQRDRLRDDLQRTATDLLDAEEKLAAAHEDAANDAPGVQAAFIEELWKDAEEPESVCAEADRLVNGDRGDDYGHPLDDFARTAKMWSAILGLEDAEVSPEEVGLCMAALKISRECNRHKRDNLVDLAGYAETVGKVHEERERRESAEGQVHVGVDWGSSDGRPTVVTVQDRGDGKVAILDIRRVESEGDAAA